MKISYQSIIRRFARHGVLHREAVKNDLAALNQLIHQGFVRKAYKSGRLFYELTEKALPLLERQRIKLLEDARMHSLIDGQSAFFRALLEDVRFLDEASPEAEDFIFLGDWQLNRPVVSSQLELAKLRFYRDRVPRRTRKAA
ncbi:MAG: hypothetical protein WC683_06495 [bacterium]